MEGVLTLFSDTLLEHPGPHEGTKASSVPALGITWITVKKFDG